MTPADFDTFIHETSMRYLSWSLQAAYHANELGEFEMSQDILSHLRRRAAEFDGTVDIDGVEF